MRRSQSEGYTVLEDRFTELDGIYCSLGQSLSYYEILKSLGREIYAPALRALRDVVYTPAIRLEFRREYAFTTSLLRYGSSARIIEDSADLFTQLHSGPEELSFGPIRLEFMTNVGGSTFRFPVNFDDSGRLPGRINVIIGYNGAGKTRLLANLAMVAFSDLTSRKTIGFRDRYGFLTVGAEDRFGSVVNVSYSAFDTFEVPGVTAEERAFMESSGKSVGYVYCGLRKFGLDGSSAERLDQLKSLAEIREEFFNTVALLRTQERSRMYRRALQPLAEEPSFQRLGITIEALTSGNVVDIFDSLSSGHKIVLNIVAQLSAYLQPHSLVLLDEPECHLHPPLLAALLKSLNVLLEDGSSFAIIATHSPVVLQETPKRYVRILRRFGDETFVDEPETETFGENVGTLTRQVFNLDSIKTDFHHWLRELSETMTLDQISQLFPEGMSGQARAYLVTLARGRTD
ncbi:AAA family ATPase [Micromonospora echinofusca]|uniref:AAA family ATPase n=1 Tax=Micromonospora echinofusca TaxID=47858 RepID=UPI0037AEC7DB